MLLMNENRPREEYCNRRANWRKYDLPCCCVQTDGVEKRRRESHEAQAIVSTSTLTQPLLAHSKGLTT